MTGFSTEDRGSRGKGNKIRKKSGENFLQSMSRFLNVDALLSCPTFGVQRQEPYFVLTGKL